MPSKIGTFIKNAREKKGLTIQEVASKMPITASTVGQIESGDIQTPSTPVINAFSKVLGVSSSSLLRLLPKGAEPKRAVSVNKEAIYYAVLKQK